MSDVPARLDYASPVDAEANWHRAKFYHRIVLVCIFFPMSVGAATVLFYWLFDWNWLVGAGLLMLPFGALIVIVGLVFLMIWANQRREHARKMRTPFPRRELLVLIALLLSNFLVAVGCVALSAPMVFEPRVAVSVVNDSGAVLNRCCIRSTWSPRATRLLAPGDSMSEVFKESRCGGLHLHVEAGANSVDVPLTSPGGGGGLFDSDPKIVVHVGPDLKMDVQSTPGD